MRRVVRRVSRTYVVTTEGKPMRNYDNYTVSHLLDSHLAQEHAYRVNIRNKYANSNSAPLDIKISKERAYQAWKEIEYRASIYIMMKQFALMSSARVMG